LSVMDQPDSLQPWPAVTMASSTAAPVAVLSPPICEPAPNTQESAAAEAPQEPPSHRSVDGTLVTDSRPARQAMTAALPAGTMMSLHLDRYTNEEGETCCEEFAY
jgi:hypothetical protein